MRLDLVCVAVAALGCRNFANSAPTDITGTWSGAINDPAGFPTFAFDLTQNATSVTGTGNCALAPSAAPCATTVTGTFTFPQLHLAITWNTGSTSSYTGVLDPAGTIAGTLSGWGLLDLGRLKPGESS